MDSSSNQSVFSDVQTAITEPKSSSATTDIEISSDHKNDQVSDSETIVTMGDHVFESSSVNEISGNHMNGSASDNELTVIMTDNNRQSSTDKEVSDDGKNGADSDNKLTVTMADKVHESSTDGNNNEVSDNVKNDSVSDNETTGEMANNVGDLALEKQFKCDLYTGTWVKDENYPTYRPGSCPYVDEAYDCQINGRTDAEYTKWRWQPDDCDLPR